MIIGIVCCDKNWGIGKDNHLLFHIKKDMDFFQIMTLHNVVCMGKKTLLSLPKQKPLKNRLNVVLSSSTTFSDCINVHSIDELLEFANKQTKNVYIIGGAQLYKEMLPYYDKIFVTKVDAEIKDADTFFPNLDLDTPFTINWKSSIIKTDENYNIQFISYKRKEL